MEHPRGSDPGHHASYPGTAHSEPAVYRNPFLAPYAATSPGNDYVDAPVSFASLPPSWQQPQQQHHQQLQQMPSYPYVTEGGAMMDATRQGQRDTYGSPASRSSSSPGIPAGHMAASYPVISPADRAVEEAAAVLHLKQQEQLMFPDIQMSKDTQGPLLTSPPLAAVQPEGKAPSRGAREYPCTMGIGIARVHVLVAQPSSPGLTLLYFCAAGLLVYKFPCSTQPLYVPHVAECLTCRAVGVSQLGIQEG